MRRLPLAALLLLLPASQALAQARRPPRPPVYRLPTVSPYINLLRSNGDNPALLYQGIIRPQLEANQFRQFQQREIDRLANDQRRSNLAIESRLQAQGNALDELNRRLGRKTIETGHPTTFMNTGGYFPRLNRGAR